MLSDRWRRGSSRLISFSSASSYSSSWLHIHYDGWLSRSHKSLPFSEKLIQWVATGAEPVYMRGLCVGLPLSISSRYSLFRDHSLSFCFGVTDQAKLILSLKISTGYSLKRIGWRHLYWKRVSTVIISSKGNCWQRNSRISGKVRDSKYVARWHLQWDLGGKMDPKATTGKGDLPGFYPHNRLDSHQPEDIHTKTEGQGNYGWSGHLYLQGSTKNVVAEPRWSKYRI